MIIFLISLTLVALILVAGYYLYRVAFFPKRHSPEEVLQMEIDWGKLTNLDEFRSWSCDEFNLPSPHGYLLHAIYFPLVNAQKTIIFSHGITMTLNGSIKYMKMFRERGYNCLLYDNRFHGGSGGSNCTFGFFEKDDLKSLVDWAFQRLGQGGQVGTHGESLGAAISLQHASIDDRISFTIADCSFSDLKQLFTLRLKKDYHLPGFLLLQLCRGFGRLLAGFDFHKVSPARDLDRMKTPVLFIHGDRDGYIPPSMSVAMHQSKGNGPIRLFLAPGAKHAEAFSSNPAEYENQVVSFLDQIGA